MKENDFNATWVKFVDLQTCYELEIDPDREFARARLSHLCADGHYTNTRAVWQRLKYDNQSEPFVRHLGRVLRLNDEWQLTL